MRSVMLAAALSLLSGAAFAADVKPYTGKAVEPVAPAREVKPAAPAREVQPAAPAREVQPHEAKPIDEYHAKVLDGSMPKGGGGTPAPIPGGITPGGGGLPGGLKPGGGALPHGPAGGGPVSPGTPRGSHGPVHAVTEPACDGVQIQGNTAINAAGTNVNTLAIGAGNTADGAIGAIRCAQIQGNTNINASGTNVNTVAVGAGNLSKSNVGVIGK